MAILWCLSRQHIADAALIGKLQPALLHQAQQIQHIQHVTTHITSSTVQSFLPPSLEHGLSGYPVSTRQLLITRTHNSANSCSSSIQGAPHGWRQGASAGWHSRQHLCPWHAHNHTHSRCFHSQQFSWRPSQGYQVQQVRLAHRYHGMHARHGWAKASDERDRMISALSSWQQLHTFWHQYGGAPQQLWDDVTAKVRESANATHLIRNRLHLDKKVRPAELTPCRLTYLNLARFTEQVQRCLPRQLLHPSFNPADSVEALEQADMTPDHLEDVREVIKDVCAKQLRRGKLCDAATAGRMLLALGRLGYLEAPALTHLLLDLSTRRMEEAYLRDVCTTAQGLRLLEYAKGDAWWTAAWSHVANILPTGMYDPSNVSRLFKVGAELGHPAPAHLLTLHTALSGHQLTPPQQQLQASGQSQAALATA